MDRPIEFKRIRLRRGDILVVREPADAPDDFRETIINKVTRVVNPEHVLLVFVPRLSDIKALGEEHMKKLGWKKVEDA